jgi:hypothetical protein
LWVGLMGLIGMKPALEAWRDATGAEMFKVQGAEGRKRLYDVGLSDDGDGGKCGRGLVCCSL